MTEFRTIEARAYHCGQMCRLLRIEHQEAVAQIGIDAHRELRARFEASVFRRAWLINGKLAALFGVTGGMLSSGGFLWLALSVEAQRHPVAIVKEGRRQLDDIMRTKRELATTILGHDHAALRLAIFFGFHVSDHGPGKRAIDCQGRRVLSRFVRDVPDHRMPIGSGYAIAMGYHHEEAA